MRVRYHGLRRLPTCRNGKCYSTCKFISARPKLTPSSVLYPFNYRRFIRKWSRFSSTISARPSLREPREQVPVDDISSSFPSPRNHKNVAAWVVLLEPFLPSNLRDDPSSANSDSPDPSQAVIIAHILYQARRRANIDILSHFGLVAGRWEAMTVLVQIMLEHTVGLGQRHLRPKLFSTLQFPKNTSLSAMTERWQNIKGHIKQEIKRPIRQDSAAPTLALWTADRYVERRSQIVVQNKQSLGQIWQSLGNMIIAAAKAENKERDKIMTHVLQIIALLHQREMIPSSIYNYMPNDDPSALQQPPLLPQYSTWMLSSLYDAVNKTKSQESAPVPVKGSPSAAETAAGPQLSPELWLEFVLWCCVHGGFLSEGSNILKELYKDMNPQNDDKWSLITWRDLVDASDESWNDVLRKKLGRTLSGLGEGLGLLKPATPRRSVKKTVSAEVVAAFVDGLTIRASKTETSLVKTRELLDQLNVLKDIFERNKLGLGVLTWNSIIVRLAASTDVDIEANPRLMEDVLAKFEQNYGHEIRSDNDPISNYIFDPSAAILGLYHRTLVAYIRSRDTAGAIRILGRLQSLTENNRRISVNEFFTIMHDYSQLSKAAATTKMRSRSDSERVQYPNFYPNIPNQTLAALIDLVIESNALEVGRWMLYAEDLDGPMITESMFNDQNLAPSLIRFAAATNNTLLLSKVIKAQSTDISGKTLVALCESRVSRANWQGAIDVFDLTRKYLVHEWTIEDLSMIVRALIQYIKPGASKDPQSHHEQASDVLQRLLRGDLGQILGAAFSQLDTVAAILASTNAELRSLTSNLLVPGHDYRTDLPNESFGMILEGVVKAYGSHVGQELWSFWCSHEDDHRIVPTNVPDKDAPSPRTVSVLFGRASGDQTSNLDSTTAFYGRIDGGLPELRVIIQQALHEHRHSDWVDSVGLDDLSSASGSSETSKLHPQLEWAIKMLRNKFWMDEKDIDEEVRGYWSSTRGLSNVRRLDDDHD